MFPVDFDLAWQWLGYNQKSDCLSKLKANFVVNEDFKASGAKLHSSKGGRPSDKYYMTVECFKSLGMMSGTEQGKLIRKYFLECEKIAKTSQPSKIKQLESKVDRLYDLVQHDNRESLWLAGYIEEQLERKIDVGLYALDVNLSMKLDRKIEPICDRIDKLDRRLDRSELATIELNRALLERIELSTRKEREHQQLPVATLEVEPLTTQFALNRLVRSFAIANDFDYSECWNRLHLEFRDRCHVDLVKRGKNSKPKLSGSEYAERNGYIEQLYAIACQIFS